MGLALKFDYQYENHQEGAEEMSLWLRTLALPVGSMSMLSSQHIYQVAYNHL